MFEYKEVKKTGYGYNPNNPIKVCGVMDSHKYIEALHHKTGEIVKYNRTGSTYNNQNKIVDEYKLFIMNVDNVFEVQKYTIYIDMYNSKTDTTTPEDFE